MTNFSLGIGQLLQFRFLRSADNLSHSRLQAAVVALSSSLCCAAMFVSFFHELKAAGVPVTLREYLTLMEAMEHDLAGRRVEDFYHLSRAALVKDERNLDKFDRVFAHVFKGATLIGDVLEA